MKSHDEPLQHLTKKLAESRKANHANEALNPVKQEIVSDDCEDEKDVHRRKSCGWLIMQSNQQN